MKKRVFLSVLMILSIICLACGCGQKKKKNWRVYGEATESTPVAFGVHPERGTDSSAQKVYNAIIYYPTGRDSKGVSQFRKIMYELNELSPEGLDFAMKDLEIIAPESLYYDFVMEQSDQVENAGPGAPAGAVLNKIGNLYYVDELGGMGVYSALTNDGDYEGKTNQEGMIDMDDIYDSMRLTFKENYNLIDCYYWPANENDYIKKYGSIKK